MAAVTVAAEAAEVFMVAVVGDFMVAAEAASTAAATLAVDTTVAATAADSMVATLTAITDRTQAAATVACVAPQARVPRILGLGKDTLLAPTTPPRAGTRLPVRLEPGLVTLARARDRALQI